MANRIPIPGWRDLGGMRLVHAYVADFVAVAIDHRDLVRLLQHLHAEIPEDKRHTSGPTLVAWSLIDGSRQGNFAVLLHDVSRVGLQDGIGVIADELVPIAWTVVGTARPVSHRA